jgi:hypothetical protein
VVAHAAQGPALAIGVHAQRHRHAAPERAEQDLVRRRPGAATAECNRLVGEEAMLAGVLTDEQRDRLHQIADRCPVKQTLQRGLVVETVTGKPEGPPPPQSGSANAT